MKSVEIPAAKTQKVQGYRTSPLDSSGERVAEKQEEIDEELIKTVLRTMVLRTSLSEYNLCPWRNRCTTRSVIMYPNRRFMRVFWSPMRNEYQELNSHSLLLLFFVQNPQQPISKTSWVEGVCPFCSCVFLTKAAR